MSALLTEVADWRLDAKLEDASRYFYVIGALEEIASGRRSYVIGRKGSGKTAIAEYLNSRTQYDLFAKKLTFKNYPFNELYDLRNDRFVAPNQYITLWKYVIYSAVLRLMSGNEAIDTRVRRVLQELFPDDPLKNLSRRLKTWRSLSASLNVLGIEATLEGKQDITETDSSWAERIEDMEAVITQHIDECTYVITFDELDEGFSQTAAASPDSAYAQLLTGLFKAVQDVKSVFSPKGSTHIHPVIFLRDDVYDTLRDPDKAKWSDLQVDLKWNDQRLRNLFAFRVLRARDATELVPDFDRAWQAFTDLSPKHFSRLASWTFMRPRDYIAFARIAARKSLDRGLSKVNHKVYMESRAEYSRQIRAELEDEIGGSLPEVREVLDVLSSVGRSFSAQDFDDKWKLANNRGLRSELSSSEVLNRLFAFSAIGHPGEGNIRRCFKYLDPYARFDDALPIVIHKSLLISLRLQMDDESAA